MDWSGPSQTLTGTIREIDRPSGDDGTDQDTVLTIETSEGQTHRVVMGPTWYVAGQDMILYRGDTVSLDVRPLPDGRDADFVASAARQQGRSMELRDQQGSPAWTRAGGMGSSRLGLASDLLGSDVLMPTDEQTGEVQDAVVDLQRRRIIMISLDPNENFLGIGDELKCVPWALISFSGEDAVRLDTSKDALVSCETMPDDLTTVTSREQLEPFFRPFNLDVDRPDRRTAGQEAWRKGGASAAGGRAVRALAEGEDVEISGQLASVSEQRVEGFADPVMVATVSTETGGSERVVLGPASHFSRHPHGLRQGDEVSIETKRAESANREIMLWRDGRPVWS